MPDTAPKTCHDAASRRGIDLMLELKTLVLESRTGISAIHLPASRRVMFSSIRKESGRLCLLDNDRLNHYGLSGARVNPVNIMTAIPDIKTIWICSSIFEQPVMYTNNGRRGDTLVLAPRQLPQYVKSFDVPCFVGDYSESTPAV